MTLNDVVIKNLKVHLRRYLSYFLCSSFAIAILFMYTTIIFNSKFTAKQLHDSNSTGSIFMPFAILVIFSVIFINYSHSSFLKSRRKEFGVLMTFGMSKRIIRRVILVENGLIALASLVAGLLSGTVFSRLFFMAILKVQDLTNIPYILNYKSYALTVAIFATIFLIVLLIGVLTTSSFRAIDLIKSEKAKEENFVRSPILGVVGILMLVISLAYLCTNFANASDGGGRMLLWCSVFCILGLYISVSQMGSLILRLIAHNKKYYYKSILLVSNLNFRFRQTKRIIIVITLMVAVAVFFTSFGYFFSKAARHFAADYQPYHIAYIEPPTFEHLNVKEMNNVIASTKNQNTDHKTMEFLQVSKYLGANRSTMTVFSEDTIKKISNNYLDVKKGSFISVTQVDTKKNNDNAKDNGLAPIILPLELESGGKLYRFNFQEEIYKIYFNQIQGFPQGITILDNEDYLKIKSGIDPSSCWNVQLYNFKSWSKTKSLADSLQVIYTRAIRGSVRNSNYSDIDYVQLKVASRIGTYLNRKQQGALFLFFISFIGLLFFISWAVTLYLKFMTQLEADIDRFRKLFRIGMKKKLIKKNIFYEMRLVFYLPVIMGIIIAFVYTYAFSTELSDQTDNFISVAVISFIYLTLQTIYYLMVSRIYSRKVIERLTVRS